MTSDRPSANNPRSGFTLVEVLAALGVFSIAALGLVHVTTENARTTRLLENQALARIVAENQMAETITKRERLEIRAQTFEASLANQSWLIRETIVPTTTEGVFQIQIEVALEPDTDEEPTTLAELIAFRGGYR